MPDIVVSKEELKEALKILRDKYEIDKGFMGYKPRIEMLELIIKLSAAIIDREDEQNDN